MSTSKPGAKTWTLLCKIHKTTVLLYAEPTTTLTALKSELLKALYDTTAGDGLPTSAGDIPLPNAIDGIILGKLVDPNNSRRGWERIGDEVDDIDWAFADKGKGKAVAGKGKFQNDNSKVTVSSVGLTDGALVGVMFRGFSDGADASIEANGYQKDVWDIVLPQLDVDGDDEDVNGHEGDISDSEIPLPTSTNYQPIYNT